MNSRTLVVLAVAVLVPVFCVDIRQQRCELRDQLRALVSREKVWKQKLATVICEVQKFIKQSMMRATSGALAPGSQYGPEDSEERSGHGGVDAYLRHCVAVAEGTVDFACFEKNWVSNVYLKAGEGCKQIDPVDFFQSCTHSKRSVSDESSESRESEEQFDSEEQSGSEEDYEEEFYSEEQFQE